MPEASLRSVELLQIVTQTAHVAGDPFGALSLINIVKNNANATMFVTGAASRGSEAPVWETEIRPVKLSALRQLVESLAAEPNPVVSNLRGDENPMDYVGFYFVSGHLFGTAINLRIEHVLVSDHKSEPPAAYRALSDFLNAAHPSTC